MTAAIEHPQPAKTEPPPAPEAAMAAIADAGRKLRRARKRFLDREDAESLHALRVTLRRLRAVFTLFRPILVLPRRLGDRDLRCAGHDLAYLRDLDVALEAMRAAPPEATEVRGDVARVERRRRRESYRVVGRLRSSRVRGMLRALRRWEKAPAFKVDEHTPATVILPGLRARVAAVELHPGWSFALLLGAADQARAPDAIYDDETTAELLHQLRRRIKQVRYQLEVVARVFNQDWMAELERLRVLQELLGVAQDVRVLGPLAAIDQDRLSSATAAWEELRGERLGGVRELLDRR